ncbi:MAG TPA: efflux RND transporter periplasmic adaptor subunit [Ignavibacteriaceae bacterium]|jgi:HlyD family secretion protein|nr:efflux RND transporter periplasmic adaptor subunit [Ignavibacteriaceae bacterium]
MKTILSIFITGILLTGCGNNNNPNAIEASGNIEATNVIVSSKVNGEIKKILYDEGQFVNEGDTVMLIDHETLQLQLDQAEAGVESAEAQLNLLKNGARKEDITQAEEAVKQAQVNYDLAEKDKVRMENLNQSNSISQNQYDNALAKFELTRAQLKSSKENLIKLKNFARPEEKQQAEANLNKQIAAAKLLKKSINDSYVQSPINGVIVDKFFEKGETVTQMSSLFKVSDLRTVDLIIYISEEELGKVKLGQEAVVSVDAYPDKNYTGKVIYISPEAEFTPKNIQTKDERTKLVFAVKVRIDNPKYELKPGMPADASVHI